MSELVANAIEHVHEDGDLEVRVTLADGVLRVEVLDPGPGVRARRARAPDSDRGWGLHFTDAAGVALGGRLRRPRARVVRAVA